MSLLLLLSSSEAQPRATQHYLVGLLNYPNSFIPEIFQNHTSGTYIPVGDTMWQSAPNVPFSDVPGVGFSDMEFYYDADGNKVVGQYFCLSDNGFGTSDNSGDYPLNIQHLHVQAPFSYRHGESTFDKYTEAMNLGTALIHDPLNYIAWENGADIQGKLFLFFGRQISIYYHRCLTHNFVLVLYCVVAYHIPDSTWDDYQSLRVLTGRDFDVEGLAVINQNCAVIGDELMPAIFMVNPTTGIVLSPFVRTPDIDAEGNFIEGKYLSSRRDKVHCTIEALEANECPSVSSDVVDASDYRKHDPSGGYEGFSLLADGSIAAFMEKNSGDTTLSDEPGVRVYKIQPGDCSEGSPPSFESFMGYYRLENNAGNIADVSTIPGSSKYVAVIERNGFPGGHMFPGPNMPANKLCIVDLEELDEDMAFKNKRW